MLAIGVGIQECLIYFKNFVIVSYLSQGEIFVLCQNQISIALKETVINENVYCN